MNQTDNGFQEVKDNAPSTQSPVSNQQRGPRGAAGNISYPRVSAILQSCMLPEEGPNKLRLVGRGNKFIRDGVAVRIFNVAAFASVEDKDIAKAAFMAGYQLEKAGDINGAQAHYRKALNQMMSFNVREENARDFESAYDINCLVAMVPTFERDTNSPNFGKQTGLKLGINSPRVIKVEAAGKSFASEFTIPQDDVSTSVAGSYVLRNQITQQPEDLTNEHKQALEQDDQAGS